MSDLIQRSQRRDELAHEWGDGTTGEDYVWFLATRVIEQESEIKRLKEENDSLAAGVVELVHYAALDGRNGNEPSIYRRGDVWRYHVNRCGNNWEDDADPAKAARLAKRSLTTDTDSGGGIDE